MVVEFRRGRKREKRSREVEKFSCRPRHLSSYGGSWQPGICRGGYGTRYARKNCSKTLTLGRTYRICSWFLLTRLRGRSIESISHTKYDVSTQHRNQCSHTYLGNTFTLPNSAAFSRYNNVTIFNCPSWLNPS